MSMSIKTPLSFNDFTKALQGSLEICVTDAANETTKDWVAKNDPFYVLGQGGIYPYQYFPDVNCVMTFDKNMSRHLQAAAYELDSPNVQLKADFSAIEGSEQHVPTFQQFLNQFEKIKDALSDEFDKAEVTYCQNLELFHDSIKDFADVPAETKFLKDFGNRFHPSAGKRPLEECISELSNIAKQHLAEGCRELIFFAALQHLSAGQGKYKDVANRLLKPKKDISDGAAFNAIADLVRMKFVALSNQVTDIPYFLLTADYGPALLWSGLSLSSPSMGQNETNFSELTIELRCEDGKPMMFPQLTYEKFRELVD